MISITYILLVNFQTYPPEQPTWAASPRVGVCTLADYKGEGMNQLTYPKDLAGRAILLVGMAVYSGILFPLGGATTSREDLLKEQEARTGPRWETFQAVLDHPPQFGLTSPEMEEDYQFLLAYLPLSDLATMSGADLAENVVLTHRAKDRFPWGKNIPREIWRHFVLPHRISQEPFVKWRAKLWEELSGRVEGLKMGEAALEVNHWCHEWATYQPTDGRDQDPLTTMRSGFGRCEEEMILTIAALRAVGIPARQCYTPYWAHTDDNHAWVEVWVDGGWHYLGACEPAPELDQAWFSGPVQRALLVVSTAYGDYQGPEPVLRRFGRSTNLNSTAVYGPTRLLRLGLVSPAGDPRPHKKLVLSLFNYGGWMPFLALYTDSTGWVEVECGLGDLVVTSGEEKWWTMELVKGSDRSVQLIAQKRKMEEKELVWEYCPPPQRERRTRPLASAEGEVRGVITAEDKALLDSLFALRLKEEDAIREARVWWCEVESREGRSGMPDSSLLAPLRTYLYEAEVEDVEGVIKKLEKARGNWLEIYSFIIGHYPLGEPTPSEDTLVLTFHHPYAVKSRLLLLNQLTDKDLRDFTFPVLYDHWVNSTYTLGMEQPLFSLGFWDSLDQDERVRVAEYVIKPRIDYEPSRAWRGELIRFFKNHPHLLVSSRDRALRDWIRRSLTVEDEPDRLGPPLTPAEVMTLQRGSQGDIERLYIGLCRVRMIPARHNPTTGELESWSDIKGWEKVDLFSLKKTPKKERTGLLTLLQAQGDTSQGPLYLKEFSIAQWKGEYFTPLDLGFHKPLQEIQFPIELPVGQYILVQGKRRDDGSATVRTKFFPIKKKEHIRLLLH